MNDKLINIFKEQKDFQKNFYDIDNLSEEEKIRYTKEFTLSIHRELSEILSALPSKAHRANADTYDVEHVREEIIDTFKFLLNLAIIFEMTPESFVELFFKKSKIVRQRYETEKENIKKQKNTLF